MNILSQKHSFSLYIPTLSSLVGSLTNHEQFDLDDDQATHRIISVLRLIPGQTCILFDKNIHALVTIREIVKKKLLRLELEQVMPNKVLRPPLTFALPVLKKDALETALYSLAEVGVTHIQLVITEKSQKRWDNKDHQRAQKIIIAAAEQSKNFSFPTLGSPLSLAEFVHQDKGNSSIKILCDPAGPSLFSLLAEHGKEWGKQASIVFIGPEGGLTVQEYTTIMGIPNTVCASLGPTVLRACQAAAVSASIMRIACSG